MSELFRNDERDRADELQMEAIRRHNRVNFKALLMTLAIVIAPFLALLLSVELGLAVLAAGLLFSTWLTWMATAQVGPAQRTQLKGAAILNFCVFVVVVLVLVLRLRA